MGYLMEQGKRYKVTGWHSHNPQQVMTVWADTVTETMVKGHITAKGYPLTDTCVWTRHLAESWVWVEIAR